MQVSQKFAPKCMYTAKPADHLFSILINTDEYKENIENSKDIVVSIYCQVTFVILPFSLMDDLTVIPYLRQIQRKNLLEKNQIANQWNFGKLRSVK
ncbi:hypothetical protein [Paenibacillus amylolyticus]|uniref:Uncharacterized protein n=1 Tax=Paenibacillus amylolyticus TaxID=1451 RepID=A0ABD8B218_PAEAM